MNRFAIFFMSLLMLLGIRLHATMPLNANSQVDTVWASAYHVVVTLTNANTSATSSWSATFQLPLKNQMSSHSSNGVFTQTGQTVTVTNTSQNGMISPGSSTSFDVIINMPLGGNSTISNLVAVGNGSSTPSPTPTPPPSSGLLPPNLYPICNPNQANLYVISWTPVANAQSYLLQESTTSNFSQITTAFNGNATSFLVTGKPQGSYYYRVVATSSTQSSIPSNVQNTVVVGSTTPTPPTPTPPPPSPSPSPNPPPTAAWGMEHSAWYIDWTSWFDGPSFAIPPGADMINLFVGKIGYDANGHPTMDGFGNLPNSKMKAFTDFFHAQNPHVSVKVSIGGGGGMYDRCWDVLNAGNVDAFAQGMVNFCHTYGVNGVDFDYEVFDSVEQQKLVGRLIKSFKSLDPSLETSLCTNAGFGPNFPWQAVVKTIFDAAMLPSGVCAVDRLYVMSYYDPIENEKTWVQGWANWAILNYGFIPSRIGVGIDDFDAHAYDPAVFAAWAVSQGYSVAHWAFDPARPNMFRF